MVGPGMFDGLAKGLITFVIACVMLSSVITFGIVKLIQKSEIITTTPLKPDRIEIIKTDNKVDTLYIYKIK